MTFRLGILLLLLSLFAAVPMDYAWACGSHDNSGHADKSRREHYQKSCCATRQNTVVAVSHTCNCEKNHPGQPCSGKGDGHCQCPSVGGAGACAVISWLDGHSNTLPISGRVMRQAFYYAERQPEAVYLPVWQPPKLAV